MLKRMLLLTLAVAAVAVLVGAGCPAKSPESGPTDGMAGRTAGPGPMGGAAKAPGGKAPGAEATAAVAWGNEDVNDDLSDEPPGVQKEFGPADAKVLVEVFYPWRGHAKVRNATYPIVEKYPDKVRLVYYNWASNDKDREVWSERGYTCGKVCINGESTFTIEEASGKRTVLFERAVGGEWTKEDFEAAVAQAVKKAYPE